MISFDCQSHDMDDSLTAHVSDVETTIGFRTDLVRDGRQDSTVALLEGGTVWVGRVKVVGSVLDIFYEWLAMKILIV
jgi:hypothetical protein